MDTTISKRAIRKAADLTGREQTRNELAVAKHDIKPEARDATLKAMNQAEQGWQRAIDKIGERASLIQSQHAVVSPSPLVRGVLTVAKRLVLRCGECLLYPQ